MNWTEFVARVADVAGQAPDRHVEATLDYLARFVPAFDASGMRGDLPEEVARRLGNDRDLCAENVPSAAPELAAALGVSEGHAAELVATVCFAIDEALDAQGRRLFRRNLSDDLVASFERSAESRELGSPHGHELADGRPGSSKPLSTSSPAQADSVVASEDPHGRTKLSGAAGLAQERQKRTLAAGEPGSTRPLKEHKP